MRHAGGCLTMQLVTSLLWAGSAPGSGLGTLFCFAVFTSRMAAVNETNKGNILTRHNLINLIPRPAQHSH